MNLLSLKPLSLKPPLKESCNHCGYCCETVVCATAALLFNIQREAAPCPLLDKEKRCTVLTKEALTHFSDELQDEIVWHHKQVISFGKGCGIAGDWEPWDLEWMSKTLNNECAAIDAMKLALKERIADEQAME